MFSLSIWAVLLLPLIYFLNTYWCLARNIQSAKASGIRYTIAPFYSYNIFFTLLSRPILKIADKWFPEPSPVSWRHLVRSGWPWKFRYAPFAEMGTDTFLTVSPGGKILSTADPNVIDQIMARGTDFPKATQLYSSVDIYGKNIVSSKGAAWRHHRKLMAPSFSEQNNRLVWEETLQQTQAMLASWVGPDGKGKTIDSVAGDTMRLSLHVMSRAGLGQKMTWPKGTTNGEQSEKIPAGHTMSFTDSLTYLLDHVLLIMVLPKWFLSM
jgi:hypothetical protein